MSCAKKEIANRDKSKQEEVGAATLIIEVIRKEGDKQDAGSVFMLQQHIHHQESGKQPKEDTATEYHRCLRVIEVSTSLIRLKSISMGNIVIISVD